MFFFDRSPRSRTRRLCGTLRNRLSAQARRTACFAMSVCDDDPQRPGYRLRPDAVIDGGQHFQMSRTSQQECQRCHLSQHGAWNDLTENGERPETQRNVLDPGAFRQIIRKMRISAPWNSQRNRVLREMTTVSTLAFVTRGSSPRFENPVTKRDLLQINVPKLSLEMTIFVLEKSMRMTTGTSSAMACAERHLACDTFRVVNPGAAANWI